MMFVQVHRLQRRGANEPPAETEEIIRVDLIQRIRLAGQGDVEGPCCDLILDNDETILCRGDMADIRMAINEAFD